MIKKSYLQIKEFFLKDNNLYSKKSEKEKKFLNALLSLDAYHKKNCKEYNLITKFKKNKANKVSELNYIPVDLFKNHQMMSVKSDQIEKKLVSSGTSNNLSKIYLDKNNALSQSRVLQKILFKKFGKQKKIFIFLESLEEGQNNFNAKKAAILGFSLLASKKYYPFKKSGQLDFDLINKILKKHKNEEIIIFGFTFTVWNAFFNVNKITKDLKNVTIIHGGGWKKMESKKISPEKFKKHLILNYKCKDVVNYYGMIEQIGSIFFECKKGFFHTTSFSEIVIRGNLLNSLPNKHKGLVQLISILPTSYPGHSILTQDLGTIYGEDNCKCKLSGKFFKIFGRVKKAEIRGCSNV